VSTKTALIAGATGATSKRLIEVLLEGNWRVIGISRHPPATSKSDQLSYLRADLLDRDGCARAVSAAKAVTHLFYTARTEFGEGGVEDVERNVAVLRNVLDAVEAVAPDLQHVHLVEGQKWYDVRLRPARTPTAKTFLGTCRRTSTTTRKTRARPTEDPQLDLVSVASPLRLRLCT
jgi:NAD(P)-dependent dehydrogenase (short-subunit alcohol dehydrogenase family)